MPFAASFDGEIALVTGASSGLGRHFALTLAAAGARIAVAARRTDRLDALVAEIADAGGAAHAVALDVTDMASVEAATAAIEADFGAIDILINNAGIAVDKPLFETEEDDWDRVVDTNLKGAWLMTRAVARRMAEAERGGAIVNIASILGLTATHGVDGYAAAKAGLIHLTRTNAVALARHGIRVNAIAPGYVITDINRELLESERGARLAKRVPMRRFATLDDLDGPLLLLASSASAYMTGSIVTVDGGMSLSAL
jgi:NAD(P)-dependent dehydrogenase (short-subunit alcohol dehydrogenase family)